MIGAYAGAPADFARRLDDAGLTLVSFASGPDSGFTEPGQDRRRPGGRPAAGSISRPHFPGRAGSMGSATVVSEGVRDDKFAVAAEVYNRAAEIGRKAGVTVAVHPSSHHNTLLFDRARLRPDLRPAGAAGRMGARHRPHPARGQDIGRHARRPRGSGSTTSISRTWMRGAPGRCSWAKGAVILPRYCGGAAGGTALQRLGRRGRRNWKPRQADPAAAVGQPRNPAPASGNSTGEP